jgi:hypothetical protein
MIEPNQGCICRWAGEAAAVVAAEAARASQSWAVAGAGVGCGPLLKTARNRIKLKKKYLKKYLKKNIFFSKNRKQIIMKN